MIKFLPKFSFPNRSVPVSFTPAQKSTSELSFVYPTMSGGWTVFYPSSGAVQTRIAYVDPSNGHATGVLYDYGNVDVGSDPLNPAGAISGWLSPERAMDAMYTAYGSSGSFWFLLRRNAVFGTGTKLESNIHGSWPFRGLSPTYPALIDAYGSTTGNRPKITSAETPLELIGSPSSRGNCAFKSIDLHSVRRDPTHVSYEFDNVVNLSDEAIHIYTSADPTEILVFDDVMIRNYRQAVNSDSDDPYYNALFNRCQASRIYSLNQGDSTAFYFAGAKNVEFIECVLDKVGCFPFDPSGRAPGTTRNQAFYIAGLYNDQFKFRGTMINQPGYAGVQLRGGSGHLVSGCVIMRAPDAIAFGHDQNNYDDIFGNGISMNSYIRFHQADIMGNLAMKPANILAATGVYDAANNRGNGISCGRINRARVINNIVTKPGTSSGNCRAMSFSEFSWPWDNTTHEVYVSGNIAYDWIGNNPIEGSSLYLGVDKTTQNGFNYKRLPENNFKFLKNILLEPNMSVVNTTTKGIAYQTPIAYGKGSYLSSGNTFYRAAASGSYVAFSDSTSYNWGHLMNDLTDTSSVYGTGVMVNWGEPSRDDISYLTSLGVSTASGQESFIIRAIENRKGSWNSNYTASSLITYVKAGFAEIISGSGSSSLGFTAFHALNLSVFHAIKRRR